MECSESALKFSLVRSFSGGVMPAIEVISEKCCGCRICEMACSMTHLGIFNPRKALLQIEINRYSRFDVPTSQIDVPVVCLQCNPAPCAEACPEGAIAKSDSGAWVVNREKCTGCSLCIDACSYGMISVDPQEGNCARKCDLCEGKPSCVEYCPREALRFE
jgi:anaerobic carbon-monoxide dehydrogenase iron sulfur subunit